MRSEKMFPRRTGFICDGNLKKKTSTFLISSNVNCKRVKKHVQYQQKCILIYYKTLTSEH